jgi:ABC-type transport system substrate-binding protein
MRHRQWTVAVGLLLAILAGACSGSNDTNPAKVSTSSVSPSGTPSAGAATGSPRAVTQIRRGGALTVEMAANPVSFDPMTASDAESGRVMAQIYDSLYKYDENLKPVPYLAEKVENPDPTTWVFTLRKGVKFHDGADLDAEAVKFSFDRIRSNSKSVRFTDAALIADTVVVDTYTFKVTLTEPFAPFPARLTAGLGYIVSPAAVQKQGNDDFAVHPVGSGPFKFGEWKPDVSVRVDKFDGYWLDGADGKKLPYLDRVEWKIIPDAATRLSALQAGTVDIADVRDVDMPAVEKDSNLVWKEQAGLGFNGLWLTIDRPPFDNKALRQAVSYALDRDALIKAVFDGHRVKSSGPISPVMSWARDPDFDPYAFSLDKAKAKLQEGGKPDGFEFEYWISAGDAVQRQLADLMQQQLARAGIKMNVQEGDFNNVVVQKLMRRESNAYALGLTGSLDPDGVLSNLFARNGSFNYFPYQNQQVDDLLKQARETLDSNNRAPLYKQIVPIIMDDDPYVFTFHPVDRFTGSRKVQGWHLGAKVIEGYADVWKGE